MLSILYPQVKVSSTPKRQLDRVRNCWTKIHLVFWISSNAPPSSQHLNVLITLGSLWELAPCAFDHRSQYFVVALLDRRGKHRVAFGLNPQCDLFSTFWTVPAAAITKTRRVRGWGRGGGPRWRWIYGSKAGRRRSGRFTIQDSGGSGMVRNRTNISRRSSGYARTANCSQVAWEQVIKHWILWGIWGAGSGPSRQRAEVETKSVRTLCPCGCRARAFIWAIVCRGKWHEHRVARDSSERGGITVPKTKVHLHGTICSCWLEYIIVKEVEHAGVECCQRAPIKRIGRLWRCGACWSGRGRWSGNVARRGTILSQWKSKGTLFEGHVLALETTQEIPKILVLVLRPFVLGFQFCYFVLQLNGTWETAHTIASTGRSLTSLTCFSFLSLNALWAARFCSFRFINRTSSLFYW